MSQMIVEYVTKSSRFRERANQIPAMGEEVVVDEEIYLVGSVRHFARNDSLDAIVFLAPNKVCPECCGEGIEVVDGKIRLCWYCAGSCTD